MSGFNWKLFVAGMVLGCVALGLAAGKLFADLEARLDKLEASISAEGAKELVAVDLQGYMDAEYKKLRQGKLTERAYLANVKGFIEKIKRMPPGTMVIAKEAAYANIRTVDLDEYGAK